jgi:hypothetical protein
MLIVLLSANNHFRMRRSIKFRDNLVWDLFFLHLLFLKNLYGEQWNIFFMVFSISYTIFFLKSRKDKVIKMKTRNKSSKCFSKLNEHWSSPKQKLYKKTLLYVSVIGYVNLAKYRDSTFIAENADFIRGAKISSNRIHRLRLVNLM